MVAPYGYQRQAAPIRQSPDGGQSTSSVGADEQMNVTEVRTLPQHLPLPDRIMLSIAAAAVEAESAREREEVREMVDRIAAHVMAAAECAARQPRLSVVAPRIVA